jgi:methionyl-tRNA synthetase
MEKIHKQFITTTLPYVNGVPHVGHAFEFVLADVISEYFRYNLGYNNVHFNVGLDEYGQKVSQKSVEEGYDNPQDFCDAQSKKWIEFCYKFKIEYNTFYRTTNVKHTENVLKFYNEIKQHTYIKNYEGSYCVGCESFLTDKDINNDQCKIHNKDVVFLTEENVFFILTDYVHKIKNVLVDKSKSTEFENLIKDIEDLSITRKNVKWGVPTGNGDVFYVWFCALLNYIFSIGYYENRDNFEKYWENSLIICGKDNLKFQSLILQGLLKANNIPQTKEILVHGIILDKDGIKMSKLLGNVIDPIEQIEKYGLDAVRYYLTFGLNTFSDSKYNEADLIALWNNDIVNGLGNLISRLLHLIDIRGVVIDYSTHDNFNDDLDKAFQTYNFKEAHHLLTSKVSELNKRITEEKPYSIDCLDYIQILNHIHQELSLILKFYFPILKVHKDMLNKALKDNVKVIIFKKL